MTAVRSLIGKRPLSPEPFHHIRPGTLRYMRGFLAENILKGVENMPRQFVDQLKAAHLRASAIIAVKVNDVNQYVSALDIERRDTLETKLTAFGVAVPDYDALEIEEAISRYRLFR